MPRQRTCMILQILFDQPRPVYQYSQRQALKRLQFPHFAPMNTPLEVHASAPISLTLRLACALGALAVLAAPSKLQAQGNATWVGTTATWDTTTNWTPQDSPGTTTDPSTALNTDTASFTGSGSATVTLANSRSLGSITDTGPNGTTSSSTIYTIGAGTSVTLYLTSGGSILDTAYGDGLTVTAPFVFTSAASTAATYTFENDAGSTGRPEYIEGVITGSATGPTTLYLTGSGGAQNQITNSMVDGSGGALSVVKNGTNQWRLQDGTFSGGLTINVGSIVEYGAGSTNGGIGTGTVTLNGGTLYLGPAGSGVTFNNPLVVTGGDAATIAYRNYTDLFSPSSMTGTGTLVLSYSSLNAGNTVISAGLETGSTTVGAFGTFGGQLQISGAAAAYTTTLSLTNAAALATATGTVQVNTLGILTSNIANANLGTNLTVAGGMVTPDGSNAGALTLAANRNFDITTGTLGFNLKTTSSYDQIVGSGTGTFTFSGGILDLQGSVPSYSATYQIFSGFASGSVNAITIDDYGSGYAASLSDTGVLSFTAYTPEPAGLVQGACFGLASLAFGVARLRRVWRSRSSVAA
jgi:hypothetical protein